LRQLSDTRIREHIIQESLEHYPNRCVCRYQTRDLHGRSCQRRHEVVKTAPLPVCYPRQVSSEMIMEWRRRHQWSTWHIYRRRKGVACIPFPS